MVRRFSFAEVGEHVQAIRRAGHRAKELVAQILAFSRQSANQRRNLLIGPVVRSPVGCCGLPAGDH